MLHMEQIKNSKLSTLFFFIFLICIPFNLRVIYNAGSASIDGYFSYYQAIFLYLSDILWFLVLVSFLIERKEVLFSQINRKWIFLPLLFVFTPLFHMKLDGSLYWYSLVKLLEFITIFLFIRRIGSKFWFHTSLVLYISALLQALLGLYQFHVQHSLGLSWLGEYIAPLGTGGLATIDVGSNKLIRAYGTFPHPNIYAAFLMFGLIVGYWLVSRATSQKIKVLMFAANIFLLLGIFISFTRTIWLTATLVSFAFLVRTWKQKRGFRHILLTTLVSCATILLFWQGILFSRVQKVPSSNSFIERGQFARYAVSVIKLNPWEGSGLGNYIPQITQMFHVEPWLYQPPHNIYLYLAAELGIPIALLFVYLMARLLISIWKNKSELRFPMLVLLLSLIFISNFDHFLVTIQQGQLLFALCLGLIAANSKSDVAQT